MQLYLLSNITKNISTTKKIVLIVLVLFIIFFLFIYYDNETSILVDYEVEKYNIKRDGLQILYEPAYIIPLNNLQSDNLQDFPNEKLKTDVLSILPPDYVFLDYVYKISGNSLSTFHRDVTSSSNIYNTDFPIYTMIIYKTTGEMLSFCPNSHKTYPFVWSNIVNVTGKGGTVFVFDSELLHAGSSENCENRHAIQYKICHRNDISKLSHLNGVRAKKETNCTENSLHRWTNRVLRKLSYFFEMPINTIFYPIMIEKQDGFIGWVQDMIPIKYYNNI